MDMKRQLIGVVCLAGLISVAPNVSAKTLDTVSPDMAQTIERNVDYSRFAPEPQRNRTRLDYGIWDDALNQVVVDFGPSHRDRASYPHADVGSRIVRGHTSPYRLEGSRVTFAYLKNSYKSALTKYRVDLQTVAGEIDFTGMARDEQLAFWFNLHNVALMEKIAHDYPVRRPDQIQVIVNGQSWLLDDAPFISIRGQDISLRDIREKIVYANWSDPNVIYGFFRGNIGSPKMPRYAYKASNLDYHLKSNGYEFVNSLRGFHEMGGNRRMSRLYQEAAPYLFPDLDKDLTAHLLTHAARDVIDEVKSGKPFKADDYEYMIADLVGGNGVSAFGAHREGSGNIPPSVQRLLREVDEKNNTLIRKGIIVRGQGTVTIEDIPTTDESVSFSSSELDGTIKDDLP